MLFISRGVIGFLLVFFDNLPVLTFLVQLFWVDSKQMQVLLKSKLVIYLEKFSELVVFVTKLLILFDEYLLLIVHLFI